MQPCTYPKFQATETPTPDGTNSKPARSPPSPALHQDKEKWNLPNCRPNFLIGSKTIFDQKFFDLDLLSNKKANKNDNTERTSTKHHPGAEIFFYQNYKDD